MYNVAAQIGPSDMRSQGEAMDEINRVHGVIPVSSIRINLWKKKNFIFIYHFQ